MARRKNSLVKGLMILSIIGLAVFGGYSLYDQHRSDVSSVKIKTKKSLKKAGRAIRAAKKELYEEK